METCAAQGMIDEMAGVFKALGDTNRLKICYLLAHDATGTMGVSDLARVLGISQPAVSQHLRTLKNGQIIEARKEGYHMYFSFNREKMLHFKESFFFLYGCVMNRCDQETSPTAERRES